MNPYGKYLTAKPATIMQLDRWDMARRVLAMMSRGATLTNAIESHGHAASTDDVADVLAWGQLGVDAGM